MAKEGLFCSFCGRHASQVKKLIAGPQSNIAICSECIEICRSLLAQQQGNVVEENTDNEHPLFQGGVHCFPQYKRRVYGRDRRGKYKHIPFHNRHNIRWILKFRRVC